MTADRTVSGASRHLVEGTVLGVRRMPIPHGGTRYQMLVLSKEGFRLSGTVPRSGWPGYIWDSEDRGYRLTGVRRGARVRFRAEVDWSRHDHTFGMFRRPTQFEILSGGLGA